MRSACCAIVHLLVANMMMMIIVSSFVSPGSLEGPYGVKEIQQAPQLCIQWGQLYRMVLLLL